MPFFPPLCLSIPHFWISSFLFFRLSWLSSLEASPSVKLVQIWQNLRRREVPPMPSGRSSIRYLDWFKIPGPASFLFYRSELTFQMLQVKIHLRCGLWNLLKENLCNKFTFLDDQTLWIFNIQSVKIFIDVVYSVYDNHSDVERKSFSTSPSSSSHLSVGSGNHPRFPSFPITAVTWLC